MGNSSHMSSQKQTNEKAISILSNICSISIIILACMQILGIWKNAINVMEPLWGVLLLIQTVHNWKKNRSVAKMSLCATILIFLVVIFRFINI